jgi:hypothetical protein
MAIKFKFLFVKFSKQEGFNDKMIELGVLGSLGD